MDYGPNFCAVVDFLARPEYVLQVIKKTTAVNDVILHICRQRDDIADLVSQLQILTQIFFDDLGLENLALIIVNRADLRTALCKLKAVPS